MMRATFRDFLRDQDGATAIEYALIAGIVSIAVVGGTLGIRANLLAIFTNLADQYAAILN